MATARGESVSKGRGHRLRAASRESEGKRSPTKLRQLLQPNENVEESMKPIFQLRSVPSQIYPPSTAAVSDCSQSPQPGPGCESSLVVGGLQRGDSLNEEIRSKPLESNKRNENTIL